MRFSHFQMTPGNPLNDGYMTERKKKEATANAVASFLNLVGYFTIKLGELILVALPNSSSCHQTHQAKEKRSCSCKCVVILVSSLRQNVLTV